MHVPVRFGGAEINACAAFCVLPQKEQRFTSSFSEPAPQETIRLMFSEAQPSLTCPRVKTIMKGSAVTRRKS